MKKPMIFILIFAIIGILVGHNGIYSNQVLVAGIIFVVNILICFYFKNTYLILLFAIFLFSNIRVNTINANMVSEENAENVDMIAIVRTVKEMSYGYSLTVERLDSSYLFPEKFLTYTSRKYSEGDVIRIVGEEEAFLTQKNPGSFNSYNYYGARNIVGEIGNSQITSLTKKYDLKTVLYALQDELIAVYDKILVSEKSALMKSMILGDKTEIPEETMDLYRISGIYHLLVISGLHIGIISMALTYLFSKFLNHKVARIISVVFLALYCIMAGGGASTIRAVLIAIVSTSSVLLNRKTNLVVSTSFVAFLILMYNPLYLFDVGFQYSFTAVYGIAVLSSPIKKLIRKMKMDKLFKYESVKSAFIGSLSVMIFTFPISLNLCYYLLPYSVIVNMIITPTAIVLVVLGLATGILGIFGGVITPLFEIAKICGGFCHFILEFYEIICKMFVDLPYSQILVGSLTVRMTILYYMLVFTAIYFVENMKVVDNKEEIFVSNVDKKPFKLFYAGGLLTVITALIFANYLFEKPKGFNFIMLDIGQGDAFIFSIDDKYYTIDGGKSPASSSIRQYLESKGVNEIEYSFITHTDADHMEGFSNYIIEEPKPTINNVVVGNSIYTKDAEDRYFEASVISSNTKNTMIMNKGDKIQIENGYIYCLSPENKSYSNKNEASLVLLIEYMNRRILIPGDIGASTEREILNNYDDLDVDFYCLSHHGSRYGNIEEFIEEMSPKIAFVSTGRNNTYGHPADDVREILLEKKIPLLNTAENGAIILQIDEKGNVVVKSMLQ